MDLKKGLKRGPFSEDQANQLMNLIPGLDAGQIQWLNGYLTGIEPLLQEITSPEVKAGVDPVPAKKEHPEPIWILYATHTGNCESLAGETLARLKAIGKEAKATDMDSFKAKKLKTIKKVLVIVSTDGEGDPPLQAESFLDYLRSKKAPKLAHLSYSVLALGDSSYVEFCQTGKDFDAAFEKLGASKITDRVDCDVDFEDGYEKWAESVLSKMGMSVDDDGKLVGATNGTAKKEFSTKTSAYNRKNPFRATISAKVKLNGRGSSKETYHLELDLEDSGMTYKPGDALGIYALNSEELVDEVLKKLKFTGEEAVESHKGKKTLREALVSDYELRPLTNASLKKFIEVTNCYKLKEFVEDKEALNEYLYGRDILDLLGEDLCEFTPQQFIAILRKNMPRMYSISSSQQEVEEEVHITVSTVRYEAHGRKRQGLCSTFLSDRLEEGDEVEVFVDPNSRFKLPEDDYTPIIMVGPGTGVAPFRSFIQERDATDEPGKSWLFFGDRNFTTDFLYQSEWLQYLKDETLTKADVAFSRDQKEKYYVQHKMLEKGKELYQWLEEGAHFYVCGDKDHMAKDVDQALINILKEHGNLDEEKAGGYIKDLQRAGRYQTDVY